MVRYRRSVFAAPGPAAVNGVSYTLAPGQMPGTVGESGSGKSSLLRAILRLVGVASGQIWLKGQDFLGLKGQQLRLARRGCGAKPVPVALTSPDHRGNPGRTDTGGCVTLRPQHPSCDHRARLATPAPVRRSLWRNAACPLTP